MVYFLPSDYAVAFVLYTRSMQPIPNICVNLGFSVIWHTCKFSTFSVTLLTTNYSGYSTVYLYALQTLSLPNAFWYNFLQCLYEVCQMRETDELERHRKEQKINPLTTIRKWLSALWNIYLITILLNYLQIWSNMLPAAMQNEDLPFFLPDCQGKLLQCIKSRSAEQASLVPLRFFPLLDGGLTAVISISVLLQTPPFPLKYH